MYGIIGYIGRREAKPILIEGLRNLEYRGCDSIRIAILDKGRVRLHKEVGDLGKFLEHLPPISGRLGIGHTRWATIGGVSKANAHPLSDCKGELFVVHNGILENFKELKKELTDRGHHFASHTDSELIAHLIEENYEDSLEKAFVRSLSKLTGSFAVAVNSKKEELLLGARRESLLVIGLGKGENFIASDIPPLLKFTNRVICLEDGEVALLEKDRVRVNYMRSSSISRSRWKPTTLVVGGCHISANVLSFHLE